MHETIDAYCERLSDAFWAEPVNALTNLAFLIAAFLLYRKLHNSGDPPALILTGLIALIGVGSFLFHTYATPWAAAADVLPIVVFMVLAVGIGLHRRFDFGVQPAALGAAIFLLASIMIMFSRLVIIIPNGSAAYLSALITLVLFAVFLLLKRSPFAVWFVAAAPVFLVSLTLRTMDMEVCHHVPLGTHFLWHILNAITLYLVTWGLRRRD